VAEDFRAICDHHEQSVNHVLKMLVDRVIRHSERLPAAMEEFDIVYTPLEGRPEKK
jgi:hypothetical protein